MYATIRRYKGVDTRRADELTRKAKETLVPRLQKLEGFGGYYLIESGDGVFSSVGLFESFAQADEATRGIRLSTTRWRKRGKRSTSRVETTSRTAVQSSGSSNHSAPEITIRLFGRSMCSQAVSAADIASELAMGFRVASGRGPGIGPRYGRPLRALYRFRPPARPAA